MSEDNKEEIEAFKKAVQRRIISDADRLVDTLFAIAYDEDARPQDRLSAINTLMDRAIPKKGVEHSKEEETEEKGSRAELREEIERLIKKKKEEEE